MNNKRKMKKKNNVSCCSGTSGRVSESARTISTQSAFFYNCHSLVELLIANVHKYADSINLSD
jgi:hypothetical protein